MSEQFWWKQWPELLDREKEALDAAGIEWHFDDAAVAKGIMRLMLKAPTPQGILEASAVFPDAYPYFRFQVYAPSLDLPYHQNPFAHNLCLIPRRTYYWDKGQTVAGLLSEQLPKLLAAARTVDIAVAEKLEARQAEPFSDYYTYQSSMFLVQGDWTIGKEQRRGFLSIGLQGDPQQLSDKFLRGVVFEIRSDTGKSLCKADPRLKQIYRGVVVEGRWLRVNAPIRHDDPDEFAKELYRDSFVKSAQEFKVRDGTMRIYGVLFPEQVGHRVDGDSWVFLCRFEPQQAPTSTPKRPNFMQSRQGKGSTFRNY